MNKFEYKNLTPFKWFVLENFPFIEADFDALTEWQLFCKLGKEINKIIDSQNVVGTEMEKFSQAFIELQNYVNNYFDNLDVQEEINNKLNEMAEDGTLDIIIGRYITTKIIRIENTVQTLKENTELEKDMVIETLGYYNINDGGKGKYLIKEITGQETFDDAFVIELQNNLKAVLIIENEKINFLTLGAKPQDTNNNLYDNKQYLEKFVNFTMNYLGKLTLFIPAGIYGFSETTLLTGDKGYNIEGIWSYATWNWKSTIFVPLYDYQNHIIKIGNALQYTSNINFKNIMFSTAYFKYNETSNSFGIKSTGTEENPGKILSNDLKTINEACLDILHLTYSKFDNIDFRWIKGRAFQMSTSWEIDFDKLNFRDVQNYTEEIMNFKANNYALAKYPNITACNFKQLNFEGVLGNLINIEYRCSFANNTFGLINVEPNETSLALNNEKFITLPNENYNNDNAIHFSIINIERDAQFSDICINNIQLNNFPIQYTLYNNNQYIYDRVISQKGSNIALNYIVNNVSLIGTNKDIDILFFNDELCRDFNNCIFNNFSTNSTDYIGRFNVTNIRNLFTDINILKTLIGSNKINGFGLLPVYKTATNLYDRAFGNICYDEKSTNNQKLVLKVINPTIYPKIDRFESVIPLIGTKLLIRAKVNNGERANIAYQVVDKNDTLIGTKYVDWINGDGEYHWLTIDLTSVVGDTLAGYYIKPFPQNETNANVYLDVYKTI